MEFDPATYPHTFSREVFLYETDAFGHANSVSFCAYLESARFDLLKQLDFLDPKDVVSLPIIIARLECDYKKIARYNDKLTIYTKVGDIGTSSFTLEHIFVREEDMAIIAEGKVVLVAFDYRNSRPLPIPDEWREKLRLYQSLAK
jgi:acyl-CoA thioester hydrolase